MTPVRRAGSHARQAPRPYSVILEIHVLIREHMPTHRAWKDLDGYLGRGA